MFAMLVSNLCACLCSHMCILSASVLVMWARARFIKLCLCLPAPDSSLSLGRPFFPIRVPVVCHSLALRALVTGNST